MLSKINFQQVIDKSEFKKEIKVLEDELKKLQLELIERDIPMIIAVDGLSGSGKGNLISSILYPLDPRYYSVYTMSKTNEEIRMRPFLWSFWTKTPKNGHITIFDRSWHRVIMKKSKNKWNLSKKEESNFYEDVNNFEKQLIDNNTLIVKIFLGISEKEQKERFKEIEKNKITKWRINEEDWEENKNYSETLKEYTNMISHENNIHSNWHVIEGDNRNYAVLKAYKIIIEKMKNAIENNKNYEQRDKLQGYSPNEIKILSNIDLNKSLTKEEYKEKLNKLQKRMGELGFLLYQKRRSVVICYEGWDAAGKGGNIKRLTQKIDPRGYRVTSIAAPTKEELAHHYLWRFWNEMPKDGHIGIFDRTWYGRVMVERLEKFCKPCDWQRAYDEINQMEKSMENHGTIIYKFFVTIDKDEQLKRFQSRETDPLKQHKITDEDWRNRGKWMQYEEAVDEMLVKTNTDSCPWIIVEGNDKKYARIKVLEYVVNDLEKKLKE